MPGLLDIAPADSVTEVVEVRGGTIEVRGLSVLQLAELTRRFPPLADDMDRGDATIAGNNATIAAIAAALVEQIPDAEAEIARRLGVGEVRRVYETVMRLTNGDQAARPFVPGTTDAEFDSEFRAVGRPLNGVLPAR